MFQIIIPHLRRKRKSKNEKARSRSTVKNGIASIDYASDFTSTTFICAAVKSVSDKITSVIAATCASVSPSGGDGTATEMFSPVI